MIDWIFGPQCAACGVPALTLCGACRASLVELGPACPRCGEPTADSEAAERGGESLGEIPRPIAGHELDTCGGRGNPREATCRRCARNPLPIDRVVAPWRFGGQLASAIRRLKFSNRPHIARDLAPLWAPVLAAAVATAAGDDQGDAIVVAVPLHWRRRCMRGYDHAWLLAQNACAFAGIAAPVCALRRIRHAPAQSTLPAAQRAANVRGAFAAVAASRPIGEAGVGTPTALPAGRGSFPVGSIAGRAVVLVDDVMTTGATLAAAARALRDGGATSITALVLARATSARE